MECCDQVFGCPGVPKLARPEGDEDGQRGRQACKTADRGLSSGQPARAHRVDQGSSRSAAKHAAGARYGPPGRAREGEAPAQPAPAQARLGCPG
eukprot:scaffold3505_cov134-Pinguiococcus_pyrenoidosus.AAC.1